MSKNIHEEALGFVMPEYKDDFLQYIGTGKASERFFAYLENDKRAQKVALAYEKFAQGVARAVQGLPSAPKKGDKVDLVEAIRQLVKE